MEQQHIAVRRVDAGVFGFQAHALERTEAFRTAMATCVIDEDSPHHPRRNREELRTVLPLRARLRREPQIGFVDERGWLKRVVSALASEMRGCPLSQFPIHEPHERLAYLKVTLVPRAQQNGDRFGPRLGG
jgi:hypothetical protein